LVYGGPVTEASNQKKSNKGVWVYGNIAYDFEWENLGRIP